MFCTLALLQACAAAEACTRSHLRMRLSRANRKLIYVMDCTIYLLWRTQCRSDCVSLYIQHEYRIRNQMQIRGASVAVVVLNIDCHTSKLMGSSLSIREVRAQGKGQRVDSEAITSFIQVCLTQYRCNFMVFLADSIQSCDSPGFPIEKQLTKCSLPPVHLQL